ncbi:MAG: C_GCAxxG_C_C family protein [Deltaproteobacteria bacterium]|nr:C_GCAxxG_C_C family protein [Deltaproteobacteria bacterium]
MKQNEKNREMVSTVYGNAIASTSTECSCTVQKRNCSIADLAGYETDEIHGSKEIINGIPAQGRKDLIDQMTIDTVGNVWSAEFYTKKPAKKTKRSSDEIMNRMIKLAESKYNCSQIMMILALEQADCENPGLVRAMSGLGVGCGFFNETCGVMTSAASVLAWYGGKGADNEAESDKFLSMLQDLGAWFRQKTESKFKGTRCKDIAGDLVGTLSGMQICGELIFDTYNQVNNILTSYGVDI